MKKLVVVVVVLAAILLLAPYGVGKLAEKRMNHGLDVLVEQAPYLVIAERKWTGGWFKSRQEVTFELAGPFAAAMDPEKLEEMFKQEAAETEAAMDAEGTEQTAGEDEEAAAQAQMPSEDEASSEADAEAQAPAEDAAAPAGKPARFKVYNDVLHGPVLGLSGFGVARVDTTVDLPAEFVAKVREAFGPKPALEMRTRIGFFGGGTTTFTSEGRTIKPKDDDSVVTYDTFKLAVGYGRKADTYDIDGKWPKLEIKNKDGGVFLLTDLTMDGDGERVKGDLYDGDFAFRVEQIKYSDANTKKDVTVDDAHYIVDTRTKDGFVTMAAQMGTGVVKSPDFTATGIEVKEIHYDISMRHLHADSVERIFKGMREAYTLMPTMAADPSAFEEAFIAPMKEHGAELLKHDPEFSIDRVGFVTPEGEGVLKGLVKFVGVTPDDFAAPGGMAIVSKLDADITVEVAVKLAEKMPNGATAAGAAVDSGYAKREGDKYVCHIVFKNGELTVNGKPQAIPGLGGPPGGAMGEPEQMPPGE
jgi:uncharacterized protein YdgA (DUF945 family)